MKKDNFLKKTIIVIGSFLLVFTIAMIIIFLVVGEEPATLIGCVFAACSAEGGLCALIKTVNTKAKINDEEIDEEEFDEDNE